MLSSSHGTGVISGIAIVEVLLDLPEPCAPGGIMVAYTACATLLFRLYRLPIWVWLRKYGAILPPAQKIYLRKT